MSASLSTNPQRPKVQITRSFPRSSETSSPSSASPSRMRANTVQTSVITTVPEAKEFVLGPEKRGQTNKTADIFENADDHDESADGYPGTPIRPELQQPESLEQLPIEIRSLTERFIKSLSVKSHAAPLRIDDISELFQEFYIHAESHIATHIAALGTRLAREKSPAPSVSSQRSGQSKGRASGSSISAKDEKAADQQMLTPSEIADKRKARRMLEVQRGCLEEAVERAVCEKVYDRIYRHRSTDDEERDAKLRSKTAALELLGIGLKELHVDVSKSDDGYGGIEKLTEDINQRLAAAREDLQKMDEEHHPFGKIRHLTAAHKSIVETLAHVFPSTSSADEVLPTLIYTLITSRPESLNVASNLHFIQMFRATGKVDGEAAYCLVNLEAAISFLETVDLSSLNTDQVSAGPTKSFESLSSQTLDLSAVQTPTSVSPSPIAERACEIGSEEATQSPSSTKPSPSPVVPVKDGRSFHQRRLSALIQTQKELMEAGRDNFMNTADQAIDSINSTLENSFKFFFGRLKEQETEGHTSPVVMPKTLDEARQLVSPSKTADEEEGLGITSGSGKSSVAGDGPDDPLSKPAGKMLELLAGRQTPQDRSSDSNKSARSNKHVAFLGSRDGPQPDKGLAAGPADAVGNFVNSLNPLSRFGVPGFPRFGRSTSGPVSSTPPSEKQKVVEDNAEKLRFPAHSEVDLNLVEAFAQLRKTKPPVNRFLDAKDARDLRIGDVEELLSEYKRLAEVLREAINS